MDLLLAVLECFVLAVDLTLAAAADVADVAVPVDAVAAAAAAAVAGAEDEPDFVGAVVQMVEDSFAGQQ